MAYNEALQTPKKAGKSLVLRQLGEKVRFSGKEAGFVMDRKSKFRCYADQDKQGWPLKNLERRLL